MIWLKSLGLKVWAWVVGLAIGAALLYKIYQAGETGAKVDSLELTLNSVRRSKEIEANIDGLSDDDVVKRLQQSGWFRE
jgi:hypothetical protein